MHDMIIIINRSKMFIQKPNYYFGQKKIQYD